MSFYKSFAIVGFGDLGSRVLQEFIAEEAKGSGRGYKLRVLTRSKDKPEFREYASKGIDIIPVDYNSPDSLERALEGVEVVISTLRDDGLDIQTSVVYAAKASGVKLFVPSEFGRNTLGDPSKYLKAKADTQALLKKLSLPYALFFTGLWPETTILIGSHMGHDFETGKFSLFGDGHVLISWTSPRSIAPFVHHVLTKLSTNELKNRIFQLEGDRRTWRQVIAVWEAKHGRKADITVRTEEEIQKFKEKQTVEAFRFLADSWRDGSLMNGGVDNGLWPEWKAVKWEELVL